MRNKDCDYHRSSSNTKVKKNIHIGRRRKPCFSFPRFLKAPTRPTNAPNDGRRTPRETGENQAPATHVVLGGPPCCGRLVSKPVRNIPCMEFGMTNTVRAVSANRSGHPSSARRDRHRNFPLVEMYERVEEDNKRATRLPPMRHKKIGLKSHGSAVHGNHSAAERNAKTDTCGVCVLENNVSLQSSHIRPRLGEWKHGKAVFVWVCAQWCAGAHPQPAFHGS